MPIIQDFAATGTAIANTDGTVVFSPAGTNYRLHLLGKAGPPTGERISAVIQAAARKVLTVPSGGNFIVPIEGPPKIVQGRVVFLEQTRMVVRAGAPVIVDLPADDGAYDLACGPIAVGALVNVTLLPGAKLDAM